MSHKMYFVILVLIVAGSVITGCGDNNIIPEPIELGPAQQKQALMDNAHALGETLFLYDASQDVRYALFYGGQRIVFLKECILRSVKLTSNECLNLEIKKECGSGDWCTEYMFQSVGPGDYVYFENGLWRVTSYTE